MPRAKAKAATPPAQPTHTLSPTTTALAAILDAAQHSYATHTTCRRKAEALITANPDALLHSLTALTPHALTSWHKHAPTERTLAFLASLASTLATPHLRTLYATHQLGQLLPLCHAADRAVRLRSVQLVGLLLREREKCEDGLDEGLFQRVRLAVMERAEDKQPAVRAAACVALEMLQEGVDEDDELQEVPETPEDDDEDEDEDDEDDQQQQRAHELTAEQNADKLERAQQAAQDKDKQRYPTCYFLLTIASTDSSPHVRRAALTSLHIPSHSIRTLFLSRLGDASAAIRRLMYGEVGRRLGWDELTVGDRASVVEGLDEGLEVDGGVRKACAELVQQWVKAHDGDLVRLLGKLYVDVYPKQADVLVRHMMEHNWPTNDVGKATPLPPYTPQQLSSESALYWSAMCHHAATSASAPLSLDALLPSVAELCQAVELHEANPAVLRHLLAMGRLLPLRDSADRAELRGWMVRLLGRVGEAGEAGELDVAMNEQGVLDVVRVLRRTCAGDEQLFVSSIHDVVVQLSRAGTEGDATIDIFSAEYGEMVDAAAARQQQLTEQLLTLQAERQRLGDPSQRDFLSRVKQQMRQIQYELADLATNSQQFITNYHYHTQTILVLSATLALTTAPLPADLEQSYLTAILLPATELPLPGVARAALRAVGRYCVLSRPWAVRLVPGMAGMLQQAAVGGGLEEAREEVGVVLQTMTDVLIVHRSLASEWSEEERNELTACMFAHCSDYREAVDEYSDRQAALHLTSLECVCKLLLYDCIPSSSATALALLRDLFLRPTNQRLTAPQCRVPAFTRMAADSLRIVSGFLSLYVRSDRPGSQYPHSSALLSALMLGMRYIAYAEDENGQREERLHPPLRQVAEAWVVNMVQHVAHTDATPAHARQQASNDVQAKTAEEAVAYLAAFPHTRCVKALLAILHQTQPHPNQTAWLSARLQHAVQPADDPSLAPLLQRVLDRWAGAAGAAEAEVGWEARRAGWDGRLDERREEWLRLDVEYGRYEQSYREQRNFDRPARQRRGAKGRRQDSSDEEEQASEEDEVADLEQPDNQGQSAKAASSRQRQQTRFSAQRQVDQQPQRATGRPVRQSRAVAEERMALEKEKQRAEDALIDAQDKPVNGPKPTKHKQPQQPAKHKPAVVAEDEVEVAEGEEQAELEESEVVGKDKENSSRVANHPVSVSSLSSLPIKVKREQH